MSRDLYRQMRRLQRRGFRVWTVHPRQGRAFEESRLREGKTDVSDQCPSLQARKIQRSLALGRPVLVRLFRMNRKGGAFLERPRRGAQNEIARRLEWIKLMEGRPIKVG